MFNSEQFFIDLQLNFRYTETMGPKYFLEHNRAPSFVFLLCLIVVCCSFFNSVNGFTDSCNHRLPSISCELSLFILKWQPS